MNKLEPQCIDLRSLKKETLGDVEVLKMIIELFIEGIDEYINIIKDQMEHKNWHALFMATHKIKSNISMFGISQLESTIRQLENDFKNEENLDTIDKRVSTCLDIFEQVKTELRAELKTIENG